MNSAASPAPPTASWTSEALPLGRVVDGFRITGLMGVGGFGIVYRAHDLVLEREVALKEYMPVWLAVRDDTGRVQVRSPSDREVFEWGLRSFVNEARVLARFDHPSLVRVYRFWEGNGTAFMVMPIVTGLTLRDLCKRPAVAIDEAWARALLAPLLDVLGLLHAQRVIHRDISPENIVIDESGRPLLLDFGAARRQIGTMGQEMTSVLKPGYGPIEQYEGQADKQGPWTDLYALGATLHYVVTGAPPKPAVARLLSPGSEGLAAQSHRGFGGEFLAVIDWMLAVRPEERPQSVAEVADRLGMAQRAVPTAAALPAAMRGAPAASWPTRPREGTRRLSGPTAQPLWAMRSGGGLLAVLARGWRALFSPSPAPPRTVPPTVPPTTLRTVPPTVPPPASQPFGSGPSTPTLPPAARPAGVDDDDPLCTVIGGPPRDDWAAAADDPSRTVIAGPLRQDWGPDGPALPREAASAGGYAAADGTILVGQPTATGVPPARVPEVSLTIVRSEVSAWHGRSFRLARDAPALVLGRDGAADIDLPDDPLCSRRHASIEHGPEGLTITDLGSANGTFVNGGRLQPQQPWPLLLGASVRVGRTLLLVSLAGESEWPSLAGCEMAGRYRLLERLHTSPKGVVYRAEKIGSGLAVAVKLLSPAYAAFAVDRQRFTDEAAIAARLQHPHICRLDDYGQAELSLGSGPTPVPYLAYEMMAGGNLTERLADAASIPTETIARWVEHVADALGHAHEQGIVHGNLKPSTVCFDERGNVYITDFAIQGSGTRAPLFAGSPPFMAPEQWEDGRPGTGSDQFALAAIAYLLLTGSRPFEGQEDPETRERNFRKAPPDLHAEALARQRRQLPPGLTAVINRALARDPAERHRDVRAFAQALQQELRRGARSRQARDVFFSYHRESSSGWVTHLSRQLHDKHELSCYVDVQGLDGASRFPQRIQRAIEQCGVFVCLLDARTLESPYVLQEVKLAHELGKPMIPVFQEGFALPAADAVDAAVNELLQYDGVHLLDRRNIYIDQAVAEIAAQVRSTLADRDAGGEGD